MLDDTPSKVNMFANKPHDCHFKSCFFLSKGQEQLKSNEKVGKEGEASFMGGDNFFVKKQLFPDNKPAKRKNKGRHKKQRTTSLFDEHTIFETEQSKEGWN